MKKKVSTYTILLVLTIAVMVLLSACSTEGLAASTNPEDAAPAAPVVAERDLDYYKGSGHFSGDDFYDEAAIAAPAVTSFSGSQTYSGDDVYDPAASVQEAEFNAEPGNREPLSFSGDDAYDPATGE